MGRQPKLPELGDNIYPFDGSPEIGSVTNAQGLKLVTYAWRVKKPKAAVLFIHGVQSHARFEFLRHLLPEEPDLPGPPSAPETADETDGSGNAPASEQQVANRGSDEASEDKSCKKYTRWCIYQGSWVQQLNDAGCSVYAVDLQSFGFSEGWTGRRCSVERLDHLGSDVVCFAEWVASDISTQANPSDIPPMYLLGISMGGFSVIRSLELMGKDEHWLVRKPGSDPEDKRPVIVGCVALAPMLSVEKASAGTFNKIAAKFGIILSKLAPHWGIATLPAARLAWIDKQKDEVYVWLEIHPNC